MVEYSYAEARKLLEDNLNTAKEKLVRATTGQASACPSKNYRVCFPFRGAGLVFPRQEQYQHDLDFVREQAIITQVNISRTFNFEVQQRKAQEQEKSAS